MNFPITHFPSVNGRLTYREIHTPSENCLCTSRKCITLSLVGATVLAVSLITFGQGYIVVGSVFLAAVPVFFGSYWLMQKLKLDWSRCLGCLRRFFCCLRTASPVLPTPV